MKAAALQPDLQHVVEVRVKVDFGLRPDQELVLSVSLASSTQFDLSTTQTFCDRSKGIED